MTSLQNVLKLEHSIAYWESSTAADYSDSAKNGICFSWTHEEDLGKRQISALCLYFWKYGQNDSLLTESNDISLLSSPTRSQMSSKFSAFSILVLRLWNLDRLDRNYSHNENNRKSSAWTYEIIFKALLLATLIKNRRVMC